MSLIRVTRPLGVFGVALDHVGVLHALFTAMAVLFAASYGLVASYGVSIVILSAAVTLVTTPMVAWGWRSQLARTRLEPELNELRLRYGKDRRRLASETAALFKAHGASPWAAGLTTLLPAPLYLAALEVIRGLTHRVAGSVTFRPRYLPHSSHLFTALASGATMRFWGVDLAQTGAALLQISALSAGLFLGLVAITIGAGIWQQHLIRTSLRSPSQPMSATVQRATLFLPAFFAIWGLALPLGVTLYYATSALVRLMQQYALVKLFS